MRAGLNIVSLELRNLSCSRTRPNQATLLVPRPPSTSKWLEISKRSENTSNGLLRVAEENRDYLSRRICSMEVFEMGIDQLIPALGFRARTTVRSTGGWPRSRNMGSRFAFWRVCAMRAGLNIVSVALRNLSCSRHRPDRIRPLLIPRPSSTSKWLEISKRFRDTSNGVLKGLTE